MIIKRKVRKELRFMIYCVIILVGVYLTPFGEDDIKNKIGLEFILGFPILFVIIGFFRRLKIIPTICEINNNGIIITYFNKATINIPINQIKEVLIKLHSQKTAIISINLYENSTSIAKLEIYKNSWDHFDQFCKQLTLIYPDTVKLLTMSDNAGKECFVYSESVDWYEFLTQKKTVKDIFKEITNEGIIKKTLLMLGFILIIFFKCSNDSNDISIFIWFAGIMIILYLIIAFHLRMIGYSRKESIENFAAGIFYIIIGLSAAYGIINLIIKVIEFYSKAI